jgi:GST-like protein
MYLAEKSGRFLPASGRARAEVLQWLIFQVANLGPAAGQLVHYKRHAGPGNDYGLSRHKTEVRRLYDVMEGRLAVAPYLAGDIYSIADMATVPWVLALGRMFAGDFPFLKIDGATGTALSRWVGRCLERPAVTRAMEVHATLKSGFPNATEEDKDRFFGRGKYAAE